MQFGLCTLPSEFSVSAINQAAATLIFHAHHRNHCILFWFLQIHHLQSNKKIYHFHPCNQFLIQWNPQPNTIATSSLMFMYWKLYQFCIELNQVWNLHCVIVSRVVQGKQQMAFPIPETLCKITIITRQTLLRTNAYALARIKLV